MIPETSYILAYTLQAKVDDKSVLVDHFEVFCDFGPNDETPLQMAEQTRDMLLEKFDDPDVSELYAWNIAEIVDTSEHYPTRPQPKQPKPLRSVKFKITEIHYPQNDSEVKVDGEYLGLFSERGRIYYTDDKKRNWIFTTNDSNKTDGRAIVLNDA